MIPSPYQGSGGRSPQQAEHPPAPLGGGRGVTQFRDALRDGIALLVPAVPRSRSLPEVTGCHTQSAGTLLAEIQQHRYFDAVGDRR